MKKKIALFLSAVMLTMTLVACGEEKSKRKDRDDDGESTQTSSADIDSSQENDGDDVGYGEFGNWDSDEESQEAVKSVLLYIDSGELFFGSSYDSLSPGLILVTYNAQNRWVGDVKLAFYNHYMGDEASESIYEKLTDPDGSYVNYVENVRYEGKYIVADAIEQYISFNSLSLSNYDDLLNQCINDEYIREYAEGVYCTSDFFKRIYFYDDVRKIDLTLLDEKEYSWTDGKDTAELENLLTSNTYAFIGNDGEEYELLINLSSSSLSGLSVFSYYFTAVGTDEYKIEQNTLYVIGSVLYNGGWYSYMAELTFNRTKLDAIFNLYDENEKLTFDNYKSKTVLDTLELDCTAK